VAGGAVVTDSFWSQALGVRKRVVIWLPPSYAGQPDRRYPVAYYLHGAFGDETNWTRLGSLATTLDSLVGAGSPEMIVVMPDGDDGFYTTWNFLGDYAGCRRNRAANAEPADTYCVPWPHYDDYIARDLVGWVDRDYRTLPDRRHRGIAGLSMGGYGAISLALAYPDVFSAAASHSGVLAPARGTVRRDVDPARFSLDELRQSYGPALFALTAPAFGSDSLAWAARDPARLAARLQSRDPERMPALRADCGTGDLLLNQNRAFRDAMLSLGIPLDYFEHAGAHTWDYWRRHAAASAAWLATRLSVP
jgi:S-formylglutathione hydrolase FrmB